MADEGIWIGGHSTTDEERQQITDEYNARRGGYSGDTGGDGSGGYYSGYMGEEGGVDSPASGQSFVQPQEQAPAAEPQQSQLWLADPQNFATVWNKYDQDPNYEDENWSREQIDTLYDVYSYSNKGKPMEQWSPIMDNDPFVSTMDKWYDPVREQAADEAVAQSQSLTQYYTPRNEREAAMLNIREAGDYNNLNWVGKAAVAIGGNTDGLANLPESTKVTQSGFKALSSAMAGPATLKIAGALAGAVGLKGVAAALTNPWVLAGTAAIPGKRFPSSTNFWSFPIWLIRWLSIRWVWERRRFTRERSSLTKQTLIRMTHTA